MHRRTGRTFLLFGWAALVPPAIYGLMMDHGRPTMIAGLFAADRSHSSIGLAILCVALLLCPLAAAWASIGAWRQRRRAGAVLLALAALGALVSALTIRQPYATDWQPGPGTLDVGAAA